MNEDFSLISRLVNGEDAAFEILYKKHYKVLCLFAHRYVNDHFVAESIVSDVFYNIWLKRNELAITTSLRNYLMQAVKNRCYNYLIEQKRLSVLKENYAEDLFNKEMSFETQNEYPLASILSKELDLKIEVAINSLPPKTKNIFLLSRTYKLKYADIAEKTNLSVDSVKYHIKSALSSLREDLKDYLTIFLLVYSSFL